MYQGDFHSKPAVAFTGQNVEWHVTHEANEINPLLCYFRWVFNPIKTFKLAMTKHVL